MRKGALTVLEKPYQADDLAKAIRMAIETDRRQRAARAERRRLQERIDALPPREKQTMELIVAGKPNKAIARHLGVSHRTVDRLRAAVFHKMEIETAVELARIVGELRASGEADAGPAAPNEAPSPSEEPVG
jgi:FixJ family two-component response regulator